MTNDWRYQTLAKREGATRWRLIAIDDYDYESPIEHLVIGEDRWPYFMSEFYLVPAHLATAYIAARATMDAIMAQMEAQRMTSGHTKRWNGKTYMHSD